MGLLKKIILLNILISGINCYTNSIIKPLYRHWNCIGFEKDIVKDKPLSFNVGDIPLVAWYNKNNTLISTLNACKHMGSKLDKGKICDGNLLCPYHGLKHSDNDKCGEIKIHDGKIWWSYKADKNEFPATIPYNNKNYTTSYLTIDMEESLPYCIFNSMDLNHPEFVHNGLGFGSDIAPDNYDYFVEDKKTSIKFDYETKASIKAINYDMNIEDKTLNFNQVIYPSTSWSKVCSRTDVEKNIIIGVSMLPLKEDLTRWYVTIRHNYMKDIFGKTIMRLATNYILNQDKRQFKKQIKNEKLKEFISWKKNLRYENHMNILRDYYELYKYPDIESFINELKIDNY